MRWYMLLSLAIALFGILVMKSGKNNVCKTFSDYYSNRDNNPNCYYNSDHLRTVPQIIQRHGYPVETHHTTTKDGYILTLFRIPYGKLFRKKTKPVLIVHGLAHNSAVFVNVGPNSLAFTLVDAGYDVWLGNFRGTTYSGTHEEFANTTSEYWNFSFHEHGIYDLPAQIDLVHRTTNQSMYYVGYSMGNTASYIYSSLFPQVAEQKVKFFIDLAPIVFMENISLFHLFRHVWFIIRRVINTFTNGKLFSWPIIPDVIAKYVCFPFPFQMKACQIVEMIGFGFNYAHSNPETLPITMKQNSDATSLKVISHYVQVMNSGNFEYFDYGYAENIKRYGTSTPPQYDLSKIVVPHYMIAGSNDRLANLQSIRRLHEVLPKQANPYDIYIVPDELFSHISFLTARHAAEILCKHIVEIINTH